MPSMYDNVTGRADLATDDLGFISAGNKASDILGSGGTSDYNDLENKPKINNVELKGNKTSSDLGLQPTLTTAQSNAANSGITAALTEQITTNQNNISNIQTSIATYHKASGTDIYFSETEPTGSITAGSYWISTNGIKIFNEILYNGGVVQGGWNTTTYQKTEATDRCRIDEPIPVLTGNTYTITISDAPVETNNMFIMYYNSSNNIISNTGFISAKNGSTELSPPANSAFMTLMIANRAGTDCQPSDFGQITINHNGWN